MPKNPHGDADALLELADKLKSCDPEIQNYVYALVAENLKLQKKIAKLQAKVTSQKNEIAALVENGILDSDMEMSDEEHVNETARLMAQTASNHPQAQ